MRPTTMLLAIAAAMMALTAATHSLLGERRLIQPIIALNVGVIARPLAQQVLRFAWHFTSVLMLASAFTVAWPTTPAPVIIAIGAAWLSCGLADAVLTRGRHIGWPLLTAAGALSLFQAVS